MEIQELINRGRLIFKNAPKRLEVFKLVNGKYNAKEIAIKTGKPLVPTLNDLQKIRDMGLIKFRENQNGKTIKKQNSVVYEKIPPLLHIPLSYFNDIIKVNKNFKNKLKKKVSKSNDKFVQISIPSETEILEICRNGEDQLYEFKRAGTDIKTLTKEIAAFSNTKRGGLIFYGVEDDGIISGTDKRRQEIDQSLQNSIKNSIAPQIIIKIKEQNVLGQKITIISIPAWNKKEVYHYYERVYIRKGTNVFVTTPEESRKLHSGMPIV